MSDIVQDFDIFQARDSLESEKANHADIASCYDLSGGVAIRYQDLTVDKSNTSI